MRPVVLRIKGKYWDSLLYRRRLYLFRLDGAIQIINWDKAVEDLLVDRSLTLARTCAFTRGDYLYGASWDLFFQDEDIKSLLKTKFDHLSQLELEMDEALLARHTIGIRQSPFPFPHNDCTIYYDRMYVATQSGVYSGGVGTRTKYGVSTRPTKLVDAHAIGLAAAWQSVAIAAGSDGLFEWDFAQFDNREARHVADLHCNSCAWNYYSIFGSSPVSNGFLAEYSVRQFNRRRHYFFDLPEEDDQRILSRIMRPEQIFDYEGYSWGCREKLYQINGQSIRVCRYRPWEDQEPDRIQEAGTIPLIPQKGKPLSAKTAVYGVIIEFEHALVVISDHSDEPYNIFVEPVNWRAFPRSHRYENHLHVVTDDSLDIYSFNQDYFVDQETKRAGFGYKGGR